LLEGGLFVIDRAGLEAAIRRAADPAVLMQRVADEAMTLIAGVDGVLVGFVRDKGWLTFECVAGASLGGRIGSRVPLDGSLAGLAFETGETLYAEEAESDARVEQNFRSAAGVQSLVCVPLWRRAQTVGVLCVTSSRPRVFNDRDIATLTCLAEFISVVIAVAVDLAGAVDSLLARSYRDAPGAVMAKRDDLAAEERFVANILNPGTLGRLESRSRIDRFLKGRGLTHVFQPVFDMTSGDCFAVEALARFSGRPKRTPDVWFAEAHAMGVGVELEIASVKAALSSLPLLPEGITLCVNAGPEAIVSDEVRQLLADCDSRRVVMELTEETKVDDYPQLSQALGQLCLLGVRLAIDDTGAGFASFAHILKLAPDIIKLDRELTSGIDHDPVRAALATALVSFASGIGAEIIAEGIETAAELEVLRNLGIHYGQGYLLCLPTSIDLIPGSLPQELWLATTEAATEKAS
jgi:EAL domain-containing protein (putative c-di-GMP-specific phosphodiesterase class I)/putative methionine-R-sulfoxide reductase with GAF domain